MLTNVQVLPGATSVARFGDIVVWFETGTEGGGVMLTQLLQAVQAVSSGSVPSRQMGARLAAVLNTGDATAVPALVAATPEGDGLRVVVHGWGALVADGVHVPHGWADQVIADRRTFFLGRNTVTPVAPVEGTTIDLEDGVVPGDGVSFILSPPATPAPATGASSEPAPETPPSDLPAPPPEMPPDPQDGPPAAAELQPEPSGPAAATESPSEPQDRPAATAESHPEPMPPPDPAPPPTAGPSPYGQPPHAPSAPAWAEAAAAPAGRLVLDDGSAAVLERSCVLGAAPHGSPAVQTGVAIPLTVVGPGVAAVHAEIRVEQGRVAVRDLGSAATHVLAPGGQSWIPLVPGQITPLTPGMRIALGQRIISYEQA